MVSTLSFSEQLALLTSVNIVAYASAFMVLLIIVATASVITRLARPVRASEKRMEEGIKLLPE
ncbi:MAG: hypothetical protein DRO12_01415, partial [Thermoprotei archaeon]